MSSDPTSNPAQFTIEYAHFFATARNLDLGGKGTLTYETEHLRWVFTGKQRKLSGKRISVPLEESEIIDVSQQGRMIRFRCHYGKAGRKGAPFVFFAESEEAAGQIVQLLPKNQSPGERRAIEDGVMLDVKCPAFSPVTSPTNWMIGLNVMAFLLITIVGGAEWFEVTNLEPFINFGANNAAYTTNGEWWRLISSMFLHFGIIHIALNMWALTQAGHLLERLHGRALFLLLYIGAGIGGGLASIAWYGDTIWSAGASGAVFGVYGGLLSFSLRAGGSFGQTIFKPIRNSTLSFVGYNLIYGLIHPGIDNAAHIGGLLTGFAIGALAFVDLKDEQRPLLQRGRLRHVIGALLVGCAVAVPLLPKIDYDPVELLKLQEKIDAFVTEEETLFRGSALELDRYSMLQNPTAQDKAKLLSSLDDSMIPFYERWAAVWESVEAREASVTSRNRDRLLAYDLARKAALVSLAENLRNDDPVDFTLFLEELSASQNYLVNFE